MHPDQTTGSYGQHPNDGYGNRYYVVQQKTSTMALVSFILALVGLFTAGVTGVVALGLGIAALVSIRRSEGRLTGTGFAVAGIVIGSVVTLVLTAYIGMVAWVFTQTVPMAQKAQGQAQTMSAASAVLMYTNQYGEFPPPDNFDRQLRNAGFATPGTFSLPDKSGRAMSMNSLLAGAKVSEVESPGTTVLLFECRFGAPKAGGPADVPRKPTGETCLVAFVDGHVEELAPQELRELEWLPKDNCSTCGSLVEVPSTYSSGPLRCKECGEDVRTTGPSKSSADTKPLERYPPDEF